MGMGSTKTTTKTDTAPWAAQQPYLAGGFSEARRLYEDGPSTYYPGQTYADLSDPQLAGLNQQVNTAQGGNPVIDNAANYTSGVFQGSDNPYADILNSGVAGMKQTAGGDFLQNNPFLDQVYGAASKKVTDDFNETSIPGISSQFGMAGNAGSTMHELALGRASEGLTDSLGSLAANIYGGNYSAERDRQTQAQQGLTSAGAGLYGQGIDERLGALGQASGIRDAQFGDAKQLQSAGKTFQDQQLRTIEDDIKRFNYGQGADMSALQDYLAMIQGQYGGTSTSRQSGGGGSGLMQGLGTAASIAALF
ncbi:MAG: hypothetical protein WC790_00415 [Candidatus Paceibacterota bacterium]|jgi:hypothetical protein